MAGGDEICDIGGRFGAMQSLVEYFMRSMSLGYHICYNGKVEFRMKLDMLITRAFYIALFASQSYMAQVLKEPEYANRFTEEHAYEWKFLEDAFDPMINAQN